MPGGDRTGPSGMGPMTGRRMGYCAGNAAPGFTSRFPAGGGAIGGRVYGRGGGGRGWCNWYHATGLTGYERGVRGMQARGRFQPAYPEASSAKVSSTAELNMLKAQSRQLSESLKEIEQRIAELESSAGSG